MLNFIAPFKKTLHAIKNKLNENTITPRINFAKTHYFGI